ncbi:SIR2 family protein [Luteimonas sp. C4P040a]|nr:SIR2 family protein [Luteimonas fraxinea]
MQSLEDDRVVIFCGAGISMGAGLPSYVGLVKHCYDELGELQPKKNSSEWLWPDRMLGGLEGKFGPAQVRKAVYERLTAAPTTLDMHRAILRLARLRGQTGIRLVTTNFDTLFEQAQKKWQFGKDLHSGPVLPIPRNDKAVSWRSVVYLHGRLDEANGNDHLVLTSADFGRSYLTDAWAARFVARLFSDFTVLFIGYSLNDPVLRYMTDAFAAENTSSRLTAKRAPAYIFVPHKGKAPPDPTPYKHRNLRPIFYTETKDHRHLRNTVVEWADAREDYLKSTSRLIARIAPKKPAAITPSDVASLVWAVCGRPADAGRGARTFAELAKRPPIEWLDEFERRETNLLDEHAATTEVAQANGDELPLPPTLIVGQLFPLVRDASQSDLSPQSAQIAIWLAKHIGEYGFASRVIQKLASRRALHPFLLSQIRRALKDTHPIKPGLAKLWGLIASTASDTLAWGRSFPFGLKIPTTLDAGNGSLAFKVDLLAALTPSITLAQPYQASRLGLAATEEGEEDKARGLRLSEVADAKVVIPGADQVSLLVQRLIATGGSSEFLASLLPELTNLLRRSTDLFALTEHLSEAFDLSVIHRPSIVPHDQNRGYEEWTQLITLAWHGWLHLDGSAPEQSRRAIGDWLMSDAPIVRRLGIAALTEAQSFTAREKMEHLLNA